MKRTTFIFVIISILIIIYIGISYIFLNGNIIYYTSLNEQSIADSKKEKQFITDKLEVFTENDSLQNWRNDIEIWTNKYYEIKNYGIAFFWTYLKPEWRYLNFNSKENSKFRLEALCFRKNNEKEMEGDFSGIACNIGDTIKIDFYKCKEETKIGTLKIVVR